MQSLIQPWGMTAMLNNMKIGQKIYLGFGLVLLVLCGVAGSGIMLCAAFISAMLARMSAGKGQTLRLVRSTCSERFSLVAASQPSVACRISR